MRMEKPARVAIIGGGLQGKEETARRGFGLSPEAIGIANKSNSTICYLRRRDSLTLRACKVIRQEVVLEMLRGTNLDYASESRRNCQDREVASHAHCLEPEERRDLEGSAEHDEKEVSL